jgi:Carboxypeptidase regulatory-like domain
VRAQVQASRFAVIFLLAFAVICTTRLSAQPATGTVRGEVTDTSGGVLPGVTVHAKTPGDEILATAITDEVGRFVFESLPVGALEVVFELDGFESGVVPVAVQPGATSAVVERLKLAHMTEEVVVVGKAPPPPPPVLPRWEPTPPPVATPVDPRELASVCRPTKPGATMGPFGTIKAHRYALGRELYAKGDELIISGGTRNGLEVGRNLIVVRYFRANSKGAQSPEMGESTAGLVQIIAASEDSARAVVMHTCNELRQGDLLAAFVPEYVETPDESGTPSYDDAARILFADADQLLGATGRLLVVDRGSEQGLEAGNRLTLFRVGTPRKIIGEAVVISVRPNSATVRVVTSTDAIEFGDWAAPQRAAQR